MTQQPNPLPGLPPGGAQIFVEAISVHPVAEHLYTLRLQGMHVGGWGVHTVAGVQRSFIITSWGQTLDVAETLAQLDYMLGVSFPEVSLDNAA